MQASKGKYINQEVNRSYWTFRDKTERSLRVRKKQRSD